MSRRERRHSALVIGAMLFTPEARRTSDQYVATVLTECSSTRAHDGARTPPLVLARATHALHTPLLLARASDALEFVASEVAARALARPGTTYVVVTSTSAPAAVRALVSARAHALGADNVAPHTSSSSTSTETALAIRSPLAPTVVSYVHTLVCPSSSSSSSSLPVLELPAASVVYLLDVEHYSDAATELVRVCCHERATPVYSCGFTPEPEPELE